MNNNRTIHGDLMECAKAGNLQLVRICIENGADVHARDNAALRRASYNGHIQVVKYLKQYINNKQRRM